MSRGKVRIVGVWAPSGVETYDGESHRWTRCVVGVPATGYRVDPVDPGRCSVSFEVPVLAGSYAMVYAVALHRVE